MFSIADIDIPLSGICDCCKDEEKWKDSLESIKGNQSDDHAEAIRWMTEKEENSHLRGREVQTERRRLGTRSVAQCQGWMEWEVEVLPAR